MIKIYNRDLISLRNYNIFIIKCRHRLSLPTTTMSPLSPPPPYSTTTTTTSTTMPPSPSIIAATIIDHHHPLSPSLRPPSFSHTINTHPPQLPQLTIPSQSTTTAGTAYHYNLPPPTLFKHCLDGFSSSCSWENLLVRKEQFFALTSQPKLPSSHSRDLPCIRE